MKIREAKIRNRLDSVSGQLDGKSFSRALQTLIDLRIFGKSEENDRYFSLDPLYKLIQRQ
jgi:hypothetical protein